MSKTKQELEQAIVMLEEKVVSNTSEMVSVQADLLQYKKELSSVNKPVLTPEQLDNITETIEEAVDEFDFSDQDNDDKEFEIDYDNRIQLSNFDFTNSGELVEMIVEKVHELFVEAEMIGSEIDND